MYLSIFKSFFSPTRNVITFSTYQSLQRCLTDCTNILNVGASTHTVLGSRFWDFVPSSISITTLDIDPDSGADLICDVASIPLPDDTFDLVVCQHAEHFDDLDYIREIKL